MELKQLLTKKRLLLVIAHPDDEAMFFSPLLIAMRNTGMLYILCLSTGNAENLGELRRNELYSSAQHYDIAPTNISIIDHNMLQDGLRTAWSAHLISSIIIDHIHTINPDVVTVP